MKKKILLCLMLLGSLLCHGQFDTSFFYKNVKIQNKDLVVDTVKLRYGILFSNGSYQSIAFASSNYYTKLQINDTLLDYLRSNNDTATNLSISDSLLKFNMGNNSILFFDDTGNVYIGNYPTVPTPSGTRNVFIGYRTGWKVTTGYGNIGIGYLSLDSVTTGNKIVSIGDYSGTRIKTGNSSLFIGSFSGQNTQTTSGQTNTFVGYGSGTQNTTGYENAYYGSFSGNQNITGIRNTALGEYNYYGDSANAGSYNVYVGYGVARQNRGNLNIMLGAYSGYANVANQYTGDTNIYLGPYSGYGSYGDKNIYLGPYAGYNQTSEDNLLLIGNQNYGSKANEYTNSLLYGNFSTKRLYINNWVSTDTIENTDSLTIKASSNVFKFKNDGFHVGTNADGSIYTGSLTFGNGANIADSYNTIQLEDDTLLIRNTANDSITLIPGDTAKIVSNHDDIYIKELTTDSIHNFKTDRIVIPDQTLYKGTQYWGNNLGGRYLTTIGGNNVPGWGNISVGDSAGMNITNGHYNTFLGFKAGYAATQAMANTCIGYRSGEKIIGNDTIFYNSGVGYANTFVGSQAGRDCDTGGYNTGVGVDVLHNLTGGKNNCAFGVHAGNNTTVGMYNCYFGFSSGYNNTTGSYNVAIGLNALTGGVTVSNAVGIGLNAGAANLVDGNIFIGGQSGIANTTGAANQYLGYYAGRYNQSGENNTFFGNYAGYNMNGGGYNVFIGHQAGYGSTGITTRYYNTMIGCQVATANQGNANTIIGYQAQKTATNAGSCTMIGYKAGYYETGNYKLYIANSDDRTPLIYGEFDNNKINVNGSFAITTESNMGLTDSCEKTTFSSGNPVHTMMATDGDDWSYTINTSDQALFQNAGGGYVFDNDLSYELRHAYMDFQDSSEVVNVSQNVYSYITNDNKTLFTTIEASNITESGDTLTIITPGDYIIMFSFEVENSSVGDRYRIGIFKNNIKVFSIGQKFPSASDTKIISGFYYFENLVAGDDISFRVTNTVDNDDPTFVTGTVYFRKEHN